MKQYKECDVIMLSTENRGAIARDEVSNKLNVVYNDGLCCHEDFSHHHLDVLSDDEVEEGDYFYLNNTIHKCVGFLNNDIESNNGLCYKKESCKKIIATTDKSLKIYESETLASSSGFKQKTEDILLSQIPEWFIKEYCDKGGINKVLVEYEKDYDIHPEILENPLEEWEYLKVAEDNTISIKLKKESFNYKELSHIAVNFAINCEKGYKGSFDDWYENIDINWINENL